MRRWLFFTLMKGLALGSALYVLWSIFGPTVYDTIASPAFVIYAHLFLLYLIARRIKPMNEIAITELLRVLKSIDKTLSILLQVQNPVKLADSVEMYIIKNGVREKVVDMQFAKVGQVYDLACEFGYKGDDGAFVPAAIDGDPVWVCSDEKLGLLEVNKDLKTATLTILAEGGFKVQSKGDADRSGEVRELVGEMEFQVLGKEAEFVQMSATLRP